MNVIRTAAVALIAASSLLAHAARADADAERSKAERKAHIDAETDPTAFILSGYSLHVGLGWKRARLDLGGYAMDLPAFAHGNEGFDASFYGAGAKLQYFVFAEQKGMFVGVDGGVMRLRARATDTGESARRTQFGVGVNAGYRFMLPAGFYVTPWIGAGYTFNAGDLGVGSEQFKVSPLSIFPAIHVGYRFL